MSAVQGSKPISLEGPVLNGLLSFLLCLQSSWLPCVVLQKLSCLGLVLA